MDTPTIHARRWPWVLAWLFLTVYFVTPPREVFDQSLDRSNYATYAHFVTHELQWGVDVLPMAGPLGFVLYGYCYSGELFVARLIGDLLLCAAFSALLLHLFQRAQTGAVRWAWLGVMVLIVPFIEDLLLDAAVLVAAACLLLAPAKKPGTWACLAAAVLAFVSLIKGTHLMMCAAVFGCITLLGFLERRPTRIVRPALVFLMAFVLCWVGAGQNPLNIPSFLISTWKLASGYNLSMGLEEDPFFLQMGLALLVGLIAVLFWTIRFGVRTLQARVLLLFICLLTFVKWKHGYVRADGHVYIFFASGAILAMTIWLVGFSAVATANATSGLSRQPRGRSLIGLGIVTAVTAFSIIACSQFWLGRFVLVAKTLPERLVSHSRYLLNPGSLRARLNRELEQVRIATDLPQVRNAVGDGTIDFFGNEEGILLLNKLNYRPRPMGGGTFNVVSTWLQERNEIFVASPQSAPHWQLLKLAPFDDRLPAADDGLVLRTILHTYSPLLLQRDFLLLERVRERPTSTTPRLISKVTAPPGQSITVPSVEPGKIVLFTLDAPFNISARLRSIVYRPPVITGRFRTAHYPAGRSYVLKPAMLEKPVILSPLIETTTDLLHLYGDDPANTVNSFTIDVSRDLAVDQLTVSFYSAPRPPRAAETDLGEIYTYSEYPLHNREPVALVTEETGIRELNGEPITLVHAPGSITWNLSPDDQQLIFNYGLVPKAYLNGGTSDGVEFNVEVLWPPNDGRIVFKRIIRPHTVPQDRGMHRARVLLPPYEQGAQLRIRTHPGPDNDGAHDQSYINRVNIKTGPLVPEQFSGLGVIPANRKLPHDSVASVQAEPVFLLHAPNELVLNVPAGVKVLQAQIGLLPGAYTNGGNSDGVTYRVFTFDDSSPKREVWTRTLDPVRQESDRGMVAVTIPLTTTTGAKQVIVTTEVGPNGDRSWDQSYINQVRFE